MFPGPTESYKFISLSFLSSLCLCMCVFLVNIKQKFNESSQVDSLKLFFQQQQHLGLHPHLHLLSCILCLFAVLMRVLIYLFFLITVFCIYELSPACVLVRFLYVWKPHPLLIFQMKVTPKTMQTFLSIIPFICEN